MPERLRRERRNLYERALREILLCFVRGVLISPRSGIEGVQVITSSPGALSLKGRFDLELEMAHRFEVEDRGRNTAVVVPRGYVYAVTGPGDQKMNRRPEVFAYHWHPHLQDSPPFPHVHVPGAPISGVPIDHAHFDTGYLELASLFRLLVRDFGVEALPGHDRVEDGPDFYERVFERAQGEIAGLS